MTKEEKALHYAENWEEITGLDNENMTPIEVSEVDYIAGYNQALKDSKAPEMLQMLNRFLEMHREYDMRPEDELYEYASDVEQLIKEATEI